MASVRVGLAVLMLLPLAAAAPGIDNPDAAVPATLFAHFDGRQDFILNPGAPPTHITSVESRGLLTHSLSCTPNSNLPGLVRGSHHTVYGYVQSGNVVYGDNGIQARHQRGLVSDLALDPEQAPRMTWVLEASASGAVDNSGVQSIPVVVPQVTVRVTMREGDDISREHIAFDAGPLVAAGETRPADLSPALQGHPEVTHHEVGSKHVYVFDIPLDYEEARTLPASKSFNLRLDVFIALDQCDPDVSYYMVDWVRFHSSPDFRPRLDLSLQQPLSVQSITPRFAGDQVALDAMVSSPWGASDLRDIRVELDGEPIDAAIEVLDRFGTEHLDDGTEVHCHCYDDRDPLVRAWIPATPGPHEVRLHVGNAQQTAQAAGTVTFEIGSQTLTRCSDEPTGVVCVEESLSPATREAPAPLLALLAIGLLLLARVRQRF